MRIPGELGQQATDREGQVPPPSEDDSAGLEDSTDSEGTRSPYSAGTRDSGSTGSQIESPPSPPFEFPPNWGESSFSSIPTQRQIQRVQDAGRGGRVKVTARMSCDGKAPTRAVKPLFCGIPMKSHWSTVDATSSNSSNDSEDLEDSEVKVTARMSCDGKAPRKWYMIPGGRPPELFSQIRIKNQDSTVDATSGNSSNDSEDLEDSED